MCIEPIAMLSVSNAQDARDEHSEFLSLSVHVILEPVVIFVCNKINGT
jgi:hypothetical protein